MIREYTLKLRAVAVGLITHRNDGLCPDQGNGWTCNDPDCEACQIVTEADRELAMPVEINPEDRP